MSNLGHSFRLMIAVVVLSFGIAGAVYARDAAFLEPAGSGAGDEAVKVDPKAEIDIGETNVGVAKRASVFFVNQTNNPVKIEKVVINGDANVTAEASADDCMKQGTIDVSSRCSVEVSVTPISPGAWSVDVLMTHNGAGRITRARLTGKTSGSTSSENKESGLMVNAKETKPIDFGDVTVGDGKVVRSTLMINDSPEAITLYSIDVIEADNGLQKLDQGCAVDMELAPGASCPVTLLWTPATNGPVSTDLIIRHSGKLGFVVVPVRGIAKGGDPATASAKDSKGVPLPPSAQDLEKAMAGKIPAVSGASLGVTTPAPSSESDGVLHLIGTVGDRALLLKPGGETAIISMGQEFPLGGKTAKLIAVNARSASIVVGGQRRDLQLEAAESLVAQAKQDAAVNSIQTKSSVIMPSNAPQSVKLDIGGGVK